MNGREVPPPQVYKFEMRCDLYGEHLGWAVFDMPTLMSVKVPMFCADCLEQDFEGCLRKSKEMLRD